MLRLDQDALLPDSIIPDAHARKAAVLKLRTARKALGSALESCRTGRGQGYCVAMEQQLAGLDQLGQELEGKSEAADPADDDS